MTEENVKFLGTIKDNKSCPFDVVDVIETSSTDKKKRPTVQAYGTRTHHRAVKDGVQVNVMRNGVGTIRAARIATNDPKFKQDGWVAEVNRVMKRTPHQSHPGDPRHNLSLQQQIDYAWEVFLAGVILLTLEQRTPDWFLARLFCFTSTTLHVLLNVKYAVYLRTARLRELHEECVKICRLHPRTSVTAENAATVEDTDLPSQLSRARAEGATGRFITTFGILVVSAVVALEVEANERHQ